MSTPHASQRDEYRTGPPDESRSSVRTVIGHGNLTRQCQLRLHDREFRCAITGWTYVNFHMVGHCRRLDCDAQGNACGLRDEHLDVSTSASLRRVTS
jgi:hypothetical protein